MQENPFKSPDVVEMRDPVVPELSRGAPAGSPMSAWECYVIAACMLPIGMGVLGFAVWSNHPLMFLMLLPTSAAIIAVGTTYLAIGINTRREKRMRSVVREE